MVNAGEQRLLTMSTDVVEAYLLHDVHDYVVTEGFVLNLDSEAIAVSPPEAVTYVLPWKSGHFFNATIEFAKRVAVFRVRMNARLNVLEEGVWDWFGVHLPSFPASTRLYMSPVDRVGNIDLDLSAFTARSFTELGSKRYEIRLNLWFAPAGTDCGIHNTHRFLEIHTQIAGTGRIEKFKTSDEATKFEEVMMPQGVTHQFFGDLDASGDPHYPWHRYIAETDCVWLAIEFHRMT